MDCNSCQPLLAEYALGHLSGDEQKAVTAHLATGCPNCAGALRKAEVTWVLLADALPAAEVPQRLEEALRQRLAAGDGQGERIADSTDASRRSVGPLVPAAEDSRLAARSKASPDRSVLRPLPARRRLVTSWILAATLLLAATIGLFAWYSDPNSEEERDKVALPPDQMEQLRSEFEQFNRHFNGSRLHLAALHEKDRQSAVHGYIVWDRGARQIHFYAFDLPQSPEGRLYRIWLVRSGSDPIDVGTLDPKPNGTASVLIDVPGEVESPFHVAVTEQDADSPLEPAAAPWLTSEVE